MQEIVEVCDQAVILFNGQVALNKPVAELTIPMMVEAMVGRKVQEKAVERKNPANYKADPLLKIENLESTDGRVNGVCLDVYPGEVV